ncbi:hypothetical protein D3C75_907850 [compost metagenome]
MQIFALPALRQRALSQSAHRPIGQQSLILIDDRLPLRIQPMKADPLTVQIKQHQRHMVCQLLTLQHLAQLP